MKENDIIKDRYQLLRPLGAGGFGEVWLAKDQMTGTQCAIKFYVRLDDKGREEFSSEYSRMLGIHHPNLLTASYYDEWQGHPFLVMDYCGGGAACGKVGQMDETELWQLIRDVASGLACLHSQRDAQGKEAPVIHQDIKPANFLQKDDGTWLISDFGISSRMRSSMSSQSGREVSADGNIPFMGPERFGQDRMLVKASDIWAIGASVYEMATGDVPFGEFGGGTQRAGAEIPHLPKERWSSDLDRLVSSCLQKEIWDRPTAELVAEYADSKLKGMPLPRLLHEAPPPPPPPKWWKWIAAMGAGVAAVLAIVLWPESSDTKAFEACRTVADYRAYLRDYGRNALHYAEAKKFVDDHVEDSAAKAQQQLTQQQAKQQAGTEAKARAEAEKKEEAAYKRCTTIEGCNAYLKAYPKGRYVDDVNKTKAELEAEAYRRCTTVSACESYLKSYPQGRYVAEVRKKKADLEKEAEKPEQPPTSQPSGSSITVTANGVSFVMKRVAGGTFQMGATSEQGSDAYDDEKPVHSVTVSTFYMGETEVTQALWKAVMGTNPSHRKGNNLPVEMVSWNDCQEFIRKLNQLTGKSFRLPTEAEWEYAARGGSRSNGTKYAGSSSIGSVAWYDDNSGDKTHAVKGKSPNELGLYDMSGNVLEWCSDGFSASYYFSSPSTNPKGPSSSSGRVLRGGSLFNCARDCRVSYRGSGDPDDSVSNLGFRLCLPQ